MKCMPTLLAYLFVFVVVGVGFVFVNLSMGSLLRPRVRQAEKEIPYECGELPIGSAWIQFDLRFYVVALLFVIFEVELIFLFPWATLFGKLNTLAVPQPSQQSALVKSVVPEAPVGAMIDSSSANSTAWLVFGEMLFFFIVLLVAYAYLWRRGDLNWVRTTAAEVENRRVSLPTV